MKCYMWGTNLMVAASRKLPTTWVAAREAGHPSVGSRTEMVMPIFTCMVNQPSCFISIFTQLPLNLQAICHVQKS